jgi:hypothetical protein
VLIVIITANATTTTLSAIPTAAQTGAVVSLTAVVRSSSGTPSGVVSFLDGNVPLAAAPLDVSGTAVSSMTFADASTHTLSAVYQANASYTTSTSAPLNVNISSASVHLAPTTTLLTATQTTAVSGKITLRAIVAAANRAPAGQVYFMDGAGRIGHANLDAAGTASYAAMLTKPGLHYFRAFYPGDSGLGASVSAAILEQSPQGTADFALSLSTNFVDVVQGESASINATVNPINGFTQRVALSCVSTNPRISCGFSSVFLASGSGTSVMIVNTAERQSSLRPLPGIPLASKVAMQVIPLISLISLIWLCPRRRFILPLACLCGMAVAGCRSPLNPSEGTLAPVGTFSISVTAQSVGGSAGVVHSVPIQIIVKP